MIKLIESRLIGIFFISTGLLAVWYHLIVLNISWIRMYFLQFITISSDSLFGFHGHVLSCIFLFPLSHWLTLSHYSQPVGDPQGCVLNFQMNMWRLLELKKTQVRQGKSCYSFVSLMGSLSRNWKKTCTHWGTNLSSSLWLMRQVPVLIAQVFIRNIQASFSEKSEMGCWRCWCMASQWANVYLYAQN